MLLVISPFSNSRGILCLIGCLNCLELELAAVEQMDLVKSL